jgi:hypothetical protein
MKDSRAFIVAVGATILIGAVAGGQFLWHRYWQTHYRDIRQGPVSLSVEPPFAQPGRAISIVAKFRNAYDEGFPTANQHVRILDENGADMLRREGPDSANVGFRFPGVESIGCAMVIAAPTEPPEKSFEDRQTIEILPQTPVGDYVVEIEPGAYCNGLPETTVRLPLQIEAPAS